ncbi:MAG TPA: hypothetical protein VE913_05330 [Longimicrobium sp.]|nr:hypothetical protein [Longimicrobium sp.]
MEKNPRLDDGRRRRPAPTALLAMVLGTAAACATPGAAPVGTAATAGSVRPSAAYELHAPSDSLARPLRGELDRAADVFERYFEAELPPIGVVVFRSPDEMRAFDWTPIRARFTQVLPWLVQFDANPTISASAVEGRNAIAHEACHLFLIGRTGKVLGRPTRRAPGAPPAYGDPALPDWFDEGVATLCEPPALNAERQAKLRGLGDSAIALAELFRMEHPAWRQLQAMIDAQRRAAGDTARNARNNPTVQRVQVPRGALDGSGALAFYAQTNSVLEFLADREGPRFIGVLGTALAGGQSTEQALAAHARRVPSDPVALEREWRAWLAAK